MCYSHFLNTGREDTRVSERPAMNTPPIRPWQAVWRLIRYRPGLWIFMFVATVVFALMVQPQAVAIQRYFNLLDGQTPVVLGVWGLVGVLLGTRLARSLANLINLRNRVPFLVHTTTLIRQNLLAHVFSRPGARGKRGQPVRGASSRSASGPAWP